MNLPPYLSGDFDKNVENEQYSNVMFSCWYKQKNTLLKLSFFTSLPTNFLSGADVGSIF